MESGAEDALKRMVQSLGRQVSGLSADSAAVFLALGDGQENGYSLAQSLGFAPVRIDLALSELAQKQLVEIVDTDLIPQLVTLTERGRTVQAIAANAAK